MHSDGRFGYRIRAEFRALGMEPMMGLANDGAAKTDFSRGVTFCPCCGPEGNNPAEDPGETMEHAYGTCKALDELWLWAAQTFLIPVGGAYAAPGYTVAIQDQGKQRRALVGAVAPHILAGLLGVVKPGILIIDAPPLVLHPWWSLIRGAVLVILEDQRQTAPRGITKYNVKCVARPPLRITQARVLQRLRDRTLEENFRLESDQELSQGILLGEVLGVIQVQEQY